MGAKVSAEMKHAIYLHRTEGKSRTDAAAQAGVTPSGLCKSLNTKGKKKRLRTSNNSTNV